VDRSADCTGSYPPFANGWHRNNRVAAIQLPRTAPYSSIASIAYSEQVGTYRQLGGSHGDTNRLYARNNQSTPLRTIATGPLSTAAHFLRNHWLY
jgi:hypothetical protein